MGCRRRAGQVELIRLVLADDELVVSRTAPGRGVWLCPASPACAELALRRRGFDRGLRRPVTVDRERLLRLVAGGGAESAQDVRDLAVAERALDDSPMGTKG